MGVRKKESARIKEVYFAVKEDHCLGHNEPVKQTVGQYRTEQGVDVYDEMNRQWRDIVIKKRSSGPTVGKPSERSLQLFDMCSYDMDSFRAFVRSKGFTEICDLDEGLLNELAVDEDKLLQFSFRFMKQVLFGERTIPLKEKAREQRIDQRKSVWLERRNTEIEKSREDLGKRMYDE
ncbi:MAG: hypothetical protein GY807_07015 [Gammaproteobacteria bacterium]|nr:hypothetical protein [Gammaproteobacteria bacterium]